MKKSITPTGAAHLGVRSFILAGLCAMGACGSFAESTNLKIIPAHIARLWPKDAPGLVVPVRNAETAEPNGKIRFVSSPELSVYLPKTPAFNRPAIMICAGGGFGGLAMGLHVYNVVSLFNEQGVVVIGLKYRTAYGGNDYVKDSLADCERGLRLIRYHAVEWGIDPKRICVQGYSAGGTVCLNLLGGFEAGDPGASDPVERLSSRPDSVALMCPWPHNKGAADYPILTNAPPVFIASALDDKTAPTAFAREIGAAVQKQGGTVEWFIVPSGGHGAFHYGVSKGKGVEWPDAFKKWFRLDPEKGVAGNSLEFKAGKKQ